MSRIQTLQIIGSKKLGGAESFFVRLHQAFNQTADVGSVAVVPHKSELLHQLAAPATTCAMRSVFDPFSRLSLSSLIRKERPDIVQTWMGRATRSVSLRPGKGPVHVARLGGFYNPDHYRHVHSLVGNTRGICDFLIRNGYPSERVHFISNFVPAPQPVDAAIRQQWKTRLGLGDDLVIFALGRLHPNKAFDTLLDAFSVLPKEINGRRVQLLLAGDGHLADALKDQARKSVAASRVHFLGWQSDPAPFFALADLFVCPSRHEPLGNVILEGWAHGVPVVSTRSDGALELITDGRDGLLTNIDAREELSAAMHQLLTAPADQKEAMVTAGRQTLEHRFGQATIVSAYRSLYEQLLGGVS
ncbi:glycosyltransferase [Marinobacterium sediminicola]|uniref:Glycosyltransferase involved in cell wall bisynthesis n=1 Tax=Marinobacterium sediminicola TaxID=518898 RepID=A0ABY1RZI4_9GAMM|nr:glycosyltransferase [Marinobacterium sediminicola]ULG69099.1 glycosyltransferase [Marinobacterium sediminicola]SMR73623.1 Glycosyltransferase involved in cell wall bisynthesis [Marinobacterium sediminicola]